VIVVVREEGGQAGGLGGGGGEREGGGGDFSCDYYYGSVAGMLDERSRSIELPSSLRSLFSLSPSPPRCSLFLPLLLGNRERAVANCISL